MTRALLLASLAALPLAASGGPRQRIAVMDVRGVQGVTAGTATILTAIVVDGASRAGFDVISQSDVSAMIGFEKQKQMLGCKDDSSCLAEIGGALGVDFVLSGQVGQIGSRLHLSFQLLESRKAKVVARAARFSNRDEDALATSAEATVAEVLAAARRQAEAARTAQTGAGGSRTETTTGTSKTEAKTTATAAKDGASRSSKADLAVRPQVQGEPAGGVGRSGFRLSRKTAWWTIGTGAALLTCGAVFGLVSAAKRDGLENAWSSPDYASLYDQRSGDIKAAAAVANTLFVAGAGTTGVGVWFLVKSRDRIAVAPSVGDGQVGLVAAGSF
jgi:TolB-like protein